jgi:low affinity Fe/Cu permease
MTSKIYVIAIIVLILIVLIQSFGLALLAYDKVIDEQILSHIDYGFSEEPYHKTKDTNVQKEQKKLSEKRHHVIKIEDNSCHGRSIKKDQYPEGFHPFAGKGRKLT